MNSYILALVLCALSFAQAQNLRLGVILSLTGKDGQTAKADLAGIEVFKARSNSRNYIDIEIVDDESNPARAIELAEQLIEEGVHALICCQSKEASDLLAPLAESSRVLMLARSDLSSAYSYVYTLEPSAERMIQAVFLGMAARAETNIAVMIPDNPSGDEIEKALRRLSVPDGIGVNELLRYSEGTEVLTPEALWVATRLPDVILIWGNPQDTILAYQSLRERGFEKQIYVPPDLVLDPDIRQRLVGAFSFMPAIYNAELSSDHSQYERVTSYRDLFKSVNGTNAGLAEASQVYDALSILHDLSLEVLSYGIGDDAKGLRSALNEAFKTQDVIQGVHADYDFDQELDAVLSISLAIVRANPVP